MPPAPSFETMGYCAMVAAGEIVSLTLLYPQIWDREKQLQRKLANFTGNEDIGLEISVKEVLDRINRIHMISPYSSADRESRLAQPLTSQEGGFIPAQLTHLEPVSNLGSAGFFVRSVRRTIRGDESSFLTVRGWAI